MRPAWDLPVVLALASSLKDKALANTLVAFGEIGLTGEVRPVAYGEERLKEAQKQGSRWRWWPRTMRPGSRSKGLQVIAVSRVDEALKAAFGASSLSGIKSPQIAGRRERPSTKGRWDGETAAASEPGRAPRGCGAVVAAPATDVAVPASESRLVPQRRLRKGVAGELEGLVVQPASRDRLWPAGDCGSGVADREDARTSHPPGDGSPLGRR